MGARFLGRIGAHAPSQLIGGLPRLAVRARLRKFLAEPSSRAIARVGTCLGKRVSKRTP
jgi:hypothetical protein